MLLFVSKDMKSYCNNDYVYNTYEIYNNNFTREVKLFLVRVTCDKRKVFCALNPSIHVSTAARLSWIDSHFGERHV